MKAVYITIFLLLLSNSMPEAQTITLEECKTLAIENYPLIKQYDLIKKAEELQLSNLSKNYLPQVQLQAQASYQSEVTKLPIDASALPIALDITTLSKDQYKLSLEFSQLIWDGGLTSAQKDISKEQSKTNTEQVKVSLYNILYRVNQLYFGILSLNGQKQVLQLTINTLQYNKELVSKMIDNEMALLSDLDLIRVEILKVNQQLIELESSIKAYTDMLGQFTGHKINHQTEFEMPTAYKISGSIIKRPELNYYQAQTDLLNKQMQMINAQNKPHFSLFMQTGYGRPGLNMLEDKFKLFAIGGIRASWNFGQLYTKANDKRLIQNSIALVNTQKEAFLFNTKQEMSKEEHEIKKAKQLLDNDNEIILLREKIRKTAESKYKNGVYQINELIQDINAESIALQTKAIHQIQYLAYIYNYTHIKGTENE